VYGKPGRVSAPAAVMMNTGTFASLAGRAASVEADVICGAIPRVWSRDGVTDAGVDHHALQVRPNHHGREQTICSLRRSTPQPVDDPPAEAAHENARYHRILSR
jgi:hypothetical protein